MDDHSSIQLCLDFILYSYSIVGVYLQSVPFHIRLVSVIDCVLCCRRYFCDFAKYMRWLTIQSWALPDHANIILDLSWTTTWLLTIWTCLVCSSIRVPGRSHFIFEYSEFFLDRHPVNWRHGDQGEWREIDTDDHHDCVYILSVCGYDFHLRYIILHESQCHVLGLLHIRRIQLWVHSTFCHSWTMLT